MRPASARPVCDRCCGLFISETPGSVLPHVCGAGPTTAAGMAAAKGWRSSLIPALLVGILGYATATFIGVAAASVFQRMQFA